MADYRDTFTSEIYVNQSQANDAIEQYTKKLADLEKQLEEIDRSQDGWEKKEKKLQKQIKSTKATLDNVRTGVENYQKAMNSLDGRSLSNLIKLKKQLNAEIKKLVPGTQEYIDRTKDLKKVEERINSLTKATQSMDTRMANWFTKYWNMFDTISRTITGVSMKFRQAAEDAAKLDDVYSDVMKTTGLLKDEVVELDKALMQIDTRTSREQLLLLARDAGKLGIQGKENILGFVRAADQIQVALGEDLGEGAIRNLGKIADVLGYTQSMGIEKSLLSIASSINAVGQASTASEAYLVDFTQRLAGVAAQTNISAADIIGFASGLDQSAMKVEMAATAFQKFIMKLYEDPAKFAQYASMEVEQFTELLENDANKAIITVLQSLKDKDGFASLVPIFKDMGLDGARAVSVLAAMATNINAVTEAQALANEEFRKANSVTEEYNVKNNNLNAQLEKARKEFKNASITLGQSLNPVMLKSTKAITYLIKALANYGKEIKAAAIAVAAFTVVMKAQTIVQTAWNYAVKIGKTLMATWKTLVWAVRVAYYKLIGAQEAATVAQAELNAVMDSNVFILLASAIAMVAVAIVNLTKKTEEASSATKKLAEIEDQINSQYGESASKVQVLTNIVHNNNLAIDQRRDALKKLQEIVPAYHADLTEEGRLINDNTEALAIYLKNLEKVTRAKILNDEYEQATAAVLKAEQDKRDAEARRLEALEEANGNTTEMTYLTMQSSAGAYSVSELTPYGKAVREVTAATEALTEAQEIQGQIMQRIERENGDAFSVRKGELSAEELEIRTVNQEYEQLFQTIRDENRDNPAAANKKIDELRDEQRKKISEIRKRYAEATKVEATENNILTQTQFEFLQERYDSLTKKEKAMVDAGYAALSEEDSKALKARYNKLMKADKKQTDQRYQAELKTIQQNQREQQNELNKQLFDGDITAEKHEEELRRIKMESLQAQLELAKKYGQDTTQIEADILGEQTKNRKADYDKQLSLAEKAYIEQQSALRKQLADNEITQAEFDKRMLDAREAHLQKAQALAKEYKQDGSGVQLKDIEARQREEENALKRSLTAQQITQEQYDAKMLEIRVKYLQERLELARQNGQDETAILQAILDAQVEAEMLAFEQIEKLKKKAQDVKDGLSPKMARSREEDDELANLKALHDAKLLSEEEYEQAVRQLHKKYAQANLQEDLQQAEKYTQQVNTVLQEASDFVSALKDAESAKLEAQYQADLTAAGDNAEKKAEIEAKYEEDKLELSKKYADTEMVINIAKTIAAGALAAIQAFAQLGPIAGGIMAAFIAATTATEVALIVQQRNAIKNSSVSSSGSSSTPSSGTRSMTGYAEGGYTEGKTTLATVGEEGVEWIAPHWMVRDNPTVFANLDRYRRAGSHGRSGTIEHGFAEGGYTGPAPKETVTGTDAAIEKAVYNAMKAALEGEWIRAVLVRKDLTELDNQTQRFKNQTTR